MNVSCILSVLASLPRRMFVSVRFVLHFLTALVVANLQMARTVLSRPKRELAPDFIAYPVAGLSDLEIVLLSHCITLTPGTTSVEIDAARNVLVLHVLDAGDAAAVCASIKKKLEEPLLALLR